MKMDMNLIPEEDIKSKIYTIRGLKVMLDTDLAILYNVETRALNQAVKRNQKRFPEDFMFQLNEKEYKILQSQSVIANLDWSKKRHYPFVFTEQGVATLSGVLKSERAIEVNIKIIRAFVSMRRFIYQNGELFNRLDTVERKQLEYDKNFEKVFKAIEDNTFTKKQGIFYDGQVFDAYKFVSDLIKSAKENIILIDNYIDESVLTLFSDRKSNVNITIYTKNISNKLKLTLKKYNQQYKNLEIKEFNKSHDRFLLIDEDIYHFGASLKDLGKKWFAFSRFDEGILEIMDKLKFF